jgi:hypothetical protein
MKKNYNNKKNNNNNYRNKQQNMPVMPINNYSKKPEKEPLISEDVRILQKELEMEKQYKPPESWVKSLVPCIPRIISSREITKEEYMKHYCLKKL